MTPGLIRGNDLMIFIGEDVIGCTTEATISISREVVEATCKDNDGARQIIGGSLSWTMTASGLWKFDAPYGIDDLTDAIIDDTLLTAKFGLQTTEATGDFHFTGSVRVTSVEASSSVNEIATWSVTFEGTGPITKTTAV